MMFTTRHSMIDRYLSGRMDAQEMKRFEELLRVDDKLRAMCETDRAIQKAMEQDKASIPASHASLETRVMSILASVGSPPAAAPPSGAWGGTVVGSTFMKTVISIVAGLGILSGVAWYVATQRSEPTSGNTLEPRHLPSAPLKQDAPMMSQPVPATTSAPTGSPNQRIRTGPGQIDRTGDATSGNEQTADEIFKKRSSQEAPGGTVITPDSMQVKLKLDMNKQKKEN
jgi:hypothetical protein